SEGDRKILVRPVNLGLAEVQLGGIQSRQYPHLGPRVRFFQFVDFVTNRESFRKVVHCRELWIFDEDWRIKYAPRMIVEVAAHHLAIFRPREERVIASVCANNPLSIVFNEGY